MNIDINLYNLRESLDEYLPADKAYAIKPSKLLWILNKLRDTEEELQAAESKLEEMSKLQPVGYITDSKLSGQNQELHVRDKFLSVGARLFLHPQVQSNADKEIPDDKVLIDKSLVLFLAGKESLNDYWFGDFNAGHYWWRKLLPVVTP